MASERGLAGRHRLVVGPRTSDTQAKANSAHPAGTNGRPALAEISRTSDRPLIFPLVDGDLLARLQLSHSYPSVSILLNTAPGPALSDQDCTRLRPLLDEARRRLAAELPARQAAGLITRLQHAAMVAGRMPAGRALALFVNEAQALGVQLPVPVIDRVAVDPTFATRDLVRALSHSPRYRLLVVSERAARLYEGWPDQLGEIRTRGFPVLASEPVERQDRALRFGRDRSRRHDARLATHLRVVDDALTARRARDPLPLVLAAVKRHLATCRALPGVATDLIGTIAGNHENTPLGRLAPLTRPVIDANRATVQLDALRRVHGVDNVARRAHGIDDVWLAAFGGRIGLLCVEESYVFPARTSEDGRRLRPADDVAHPAVLDDAVDELIELVAHQGGDTVVVDDGALSDLGRLAAVLRDN